jgi:hypothetical protein
MDPSPQDPVQPEPPCIPKISLPARLANVVAVPGDVFESVLAEPHSAANWLIPGLLLMVVSWLSLSFMFSQESIRHQVDEIAEHAIQAQSQAQPMSEQQAEQVRHMIKWVSQAGMVAGPMVAALTTPFLWGLVLWLVGTKVFKADFLYLKAVEVAGLAGMILVLDSIVRTLLVVGMNDIFVSPSLALFVRPFDPQNPKHTLLALVNVMIFWRLGVLSVGLARLSRASMAKAAVWVWGIWAGYTGLMLGAGFLFSTISKAAR